MAFSDLVKKPEVKSTGFSSLVKENIQQPSLSSKLQQRSEDVVKGANEATKLNLFDFAVNPVSTVAKKAINVVGPAAGAVNDVIGAGVEGAMKSDIGKSYAKTFDNPLINPVGYVAKKSGEQAIKNIPDSVKVAGLEAIKGGVDSWNSFKKARPEDARLIENTVNIASLLPYEKGVKAGMTGGTALLKYPKVGVRAIKNVITDIKDIGKAEAMTALEKKTIRNLPTKQADVLEYLGKREITAGEKFGEAGTEGATRIRSGQGILGKSNKILPGSTEVEEARLGALAGVQKNLNKTENLARVNKDIQKRAIQLEQDIGAKNAIIPKKVVKSKVNKAFTELLNEPGMEGEAKLQADKLIKKFYSFVDEGKGDALSILRARKKFDAAVKEMKGTGVFDPKLENTYTKTLKAIRNTTHNLLDESVNDVNIKKALKEQMSLYNLKDKIGNIKDINILGKTLEHVTPRGVIGAGLGRTMVKP